MPEAPTAPPTPVSTQTPSAPPDASGKSPPSSPAQGDAKAGSSLQDAFNELDSIDKLISETQQKRPPTQAGAKRPAKTTETDPEKAVEKMRAEETKPAEKPAEKPVDNELDAHDKEVDYAKVKVPHLVASHKRLKAENKELQTKIQRLNELEAKTAELEQIPKWQERLTATEQRAKQLEEAIRFADYEKSPEYKEKYYDPWVQTWQSARERMPSIRVVERTDDAGEVVQPSRAATPEDFDALVSIADDGKAAQVADQLFGPMASILMARREKLMDLNNSRVKALEDFRKQGAERQQQFMEQSKQMMEKVASVFHTEVKTGMEKHPEWFKPEEGDEQGKAMLERGFQNADMMFSQTNMPPDQQAKLHAALRNMAGGFPYLALQNSRLKLRVSELESELESFKKSEPTEGSRERQEGAKPLGFEAEIEEMARLGPSR